MSHICTRAVWILADSSLTPTELNFIVPRGFLMCTSVTFYSTERFNSLLMYRQPENTGSFVTFFLLFCIPDLVTPQTEAPSSTQEGVTVLTLHLGRGGLHAGAGHGSSSGYRLSHRYFSSRPLK